MAEVIFFVTETTDFNTFKEIVENNNMNYCVTTNANELHKLLREKNPSVLFVDYLLINHRLFDIHSHVKKNSKTLAVLLLYVFHTPKENVLRWEKDIKTHYPGNKEVIGILRILKKEICGKEEEFSLSEEKRRHSIPITLREYGKNYKLNYGELLILNLLMNQENKDVTMDDIFAALGEPISPEGKNRIYGYIYNLRKFVKKEFSEKKEIIRVKKNCYSLVVCE